MPVSGQLSDTAARGSSHRVGFLSPFGRPAFACWTILRPPRIWASLTVGLPGSRPDPDRIVTFHTAETRPARVLSVPRGNGVHHGRLLVTGRRSPLHSGQPYPQRYISSPRVSMTRHQREFACAHPSGLPLACDPRMKREPLGFSPELRTPPLPATHVKVETDHEHFTGTRCRLHTQPSNQRTHSHRATSCRNKKVEALIDVSNRRFGFRQA